MTSTHFHLQIKVHPIQSHQKSKRIKFRKELAHLHSHWPNNAQSSGFLFPNRGTYPQTLSSQHKAPQNTRKCRGRCTLLPRTNTHMRPPNSKSPQIRHPSPKTEERQHKIPKNPKTNTLNLRRHTELYPPNPSNTLRGNEWSVAYIGGGAGRAEGETAEEGAGRQGLRVHGARVCHGHDGAAIPPPPKLRKFFSSCGSR
jgi:hypothetical protein